MTIKEVFEKTKHLFPPNNKVKWWEVAESVDDYDPYTQSNVKDQEGKKNSTRHRYGKSD